MELIKIVIRIFVAIGYIKNPGGKSRPIFY